MNPPRGLLGRLNHGRSVSQALFLGLTLWISYRFLAGSPDATVEKYCPFGGVETLLPWLRKQGALCNLSTMNISVLAGVVILTLLFKRVFCSHICPLGAVFEWTGKLSRRFLIRSWRLPEVIHRVLLGLKYPLMVLIVVLTVRAGELVFRDLDPYYVLFTLGKGHGILGFGLWVTIAVLAGGLLLPLAFCKYLCPLAACLAPLSRFGLVRIHRNAPRCTHCGQCDKACEWGIAVSESPVVTSPECSNCLDCLRQCPVPDTLSLRLGGSE